MSVLDDTITEACPPSWEPEQWHLFVGLLREWWHESAEQWTERRVRALSVGMADFTAGQASQALRRLRDSGQRFAPRVPEIADAIHVDRDIPSWTEARALLFDAPGGVVHAGIPAAARPADEEERHRLAERAMLERAAQLHDTIAAFTLAFGARRLALAPIHDPDYGAIELQRLREQWEEFAQRADARRRDGLPLLTTGLAPRAARGPRALRDALAHLTAGDS